MQHHADVEPCTVVCTCWAGFKSVTGDDIRHAGITALCVPSGLWHMELQHEVVSCWRPLSLQVPLLQEHGFVIPNDQHRVQSWVCTCAIGFPKEVATCISTCGSRAGSLRLGLALLGLSTPTPIPLRLPVNKAGGCAPKPVLRPWPDHVRRWAWARSKPCRCKHTSLVANMWQRVCALK